MMRRIILDGITLVDDHITYNFHTTPALASYFQLDTPLTVTYTVNDRPLAMDHVPHGILAIPFVANVLPIVWLADATLIVPELDRSFYECIAAVRQGYEAMFPESIFSGHIEAKHIVAYDKPSVGRCAVFFSGGLDATQSLTSHFGESPDLISVWGSDIRADNAEGWAVMHKRIAETCERYKLSDVVIQSTFRCFDNEQVLDREFSAQLKDGWWHGIKHSLGLLGHAAPYAYIMGLSTVYIASSNCPSDGNVRCASHPSTDNHIRFANCRVIHDGFMFSRQDKTRNVVEFCRNTGNKVSLHVCWQTQSGENCCHCEKCYRTIAALLAEGADPRDYGFPNAMSSLKDMRCYLIHEKNLDQGLAIRQWTHIQKRITENHDKLTTSPYWKYLRWLEVVDLTQLDKIPSPLSDRIKAASKMFRSYLSKFKFYQFLHRLKER